jgi:hypothetical protein
MQPLRRRTSGRTTSPLTIPMWCGDKSAFPSSAPIASVGLSTTTRFELLLILRNHTKSHVTYMYAPFLSNIPSLYTHLLLHHHAHPKLHPMRPKTHVLPLPHRTLQLQRPRAQHPRQPPHTNHIRRLHRPLRLRQRILPLGRDLRDNNNMGASHSRHTSAGAN